MEQLKRGMKVGDKTVFDLETIFFRLLMVGQTRQLQVSPIYQHELCTMPLSLIDENGCLRKRKCILANHLRLEHISGPAPSIVIIDIQQMFYHIFVHMARTPLTSVKISSTVYPVTLLVQSRF